MATISREDAGRHQNDRADREAERARYIQRARELRDEAREQDRLAEEALAGIEVFTERANRSLADAARLQAEADRHGRDLATAGEWSGSHSSA